MQNPLYSVRPFANRFQFAIFLAQQFEQSILFCKEGSLCEVPFPLSNCRHLSISQTNLVPFRKKIGFLMYLKLAPPNDCSIFSKIELKSKFYRNGSRIRFFIITLVKHYFYENVAIFTIVVVLSVYFCKFLHDFT